MSGNRDREILRNLGARVTEIAALPAQQKTIRLWKALNGLRPMVMIDQICWHEMNVDGELTLTCEDEFCRALETDLRRTPTTPPVPPHSPPPSRAGVRQTPPSWVTPESTPTVTLEG